MARRPLKVAGMSPLQALILGRMAEKGWDAKTVEGRGVKHATLHRYMNRLHLKTLPRASVIEDLARGLELEVEEVRQAAKDSVGGTVNYSWRGQTVIPAPKPFSITLVVDRVDRLPITQADMEQASELAYQQLAGHRAHSRNGPNAEVLELPRVARKRKPKNV